MSKKYLTYFTHSGPPLRKLVITVGDDSDDGTKNWIKIRFRPVTFFGRL